MRYCSRCGNALRVGATSCHCCGAVLKALVPEADEMPAAEEVVVPVVQTVLEAPAPVAADSQDEQIVQERKFLDMTHRLLRWEKKAWTIGGTVFLIAGVAFALLLCLFGVICGMLARHPGPAITCIYTALVYGTVFIVWGIINMKAAGKIQQYTDTLYKDFRAANKRCNSIGMIVFCYFFGDVSLVFFVINFVRMKCNKALIARILHRQGVD